MRFRNDWSPAEVVSAELAGRDPRSPAYRHAMLRRLEWHHLDKPAGDYYCRSPYPPGSAKNDAWRAGLEHADRATKAWGTPRVADMADWRTPPT